LDLTVRGLIALVLVFDCFAIYQQVLISRLRGSGSDCEPLCGGNGKHHAVAERLC
jgi:hypothetical protein